MLRPFLLAHRYILFQPVKTLILVLCIALSCYLPIAMHLLVDRFQRQLLERAEATPIVVGARGSRFDLALHALYFEAQPPGTTDMGQARAIRQTGYADSIPLLIRYRARGFPVVGTTLDYFAFRRLEVQRGTPLIRLGDCLLGWRVAQRLGLEPGDRLLTDPENVFDLAGSYPLYMRVAGVLKPTHGPDDMAVFVDLKTAWIIAGIGHGHQELADAADPAIVLDRDDRQVVAGAGLLQYMEVTDENLASFHFHGDPDRFPVSAILALPQDTRAATLLTGRFLAPGATAQILVPHRVIDELMELIFRVKRFFDLSAAVIGTITAMYLVLVILLSLRLRRREMATMFKLGCSRFTMFRLQAAELLIVVAAGVLLAGAMSLGTLALAPQLLRQILL
jgi:putative ABC transport system permease protein